jgi:hypothetical protein
MVCLWLINVMYQSWKCFTFKSASFCHVLTLKYWKDIVYLWWFKSLYAYVYTYISSKVIASFLSFKSLSKIDLGYRIKWSPRIQCMNKNICVLSFLSQLNAALIKCACVCAYLCSYNKYLRQFYIICYNFLIIVYI